MKKLFLIMIIACIGILSTNAQLVKKSKFGSTVLTDSTNYYKIENGLQIRDSLRVNKDIYMIYGKFYMDTTRQMAIYPFTSYLMIDNYKSGGGMIFNLGDKNGSMNVNSVIGGTGNTIFTLDTAGLFLRNKSKYTFIGNTSTGMKELGADSLSLFANKQNQIIVGKNVVTNGIRTSISQLTIPQTGTQPVIAANNCNMYVKDNKFIWFYNDGGADRWYYLDLTSTSAQQVTYSATEP